MSKPHKRRSRLSHPLYQPLAGHLLPALLVAVLLAAALLAGSLLQAQESGTETETAAALTSTASEEGQQRLTFSDLIRSSWDLTSLALAEPGVSCKQFSSYDRSGWKANRDWGNYVRSSEEEGHVCAEMEGPGCLFRIWSANPSGKIAVFLDGLEAPAMESGFESLFKGETYPFVPPLAYHVSGFNAYVPLPYQKSCKVVLRENTPLYYHLGYRTYPGDMAIETYDQEAAVAARPAVDEAVAMLSNPGPHMVDLLYPPDSLESVPLETTLEPDKPVELFLRNKAGRIVLFELGGSSPEPHFLRSVLLKIFWDDAVQPAVECPLGDFFGTAFGKNLYRALPMGMTDAGGYCLFPMPFEKNARIELIQQGESNVTIKGRVVVAPLPEEEEGKKKTWLRFHAGWRRENPCLNFEYPVLKASGMGKFLGCALFIHNPRERWWGEGDEKIWIDGEEFPSYFGTGSEDYFGDAWGHRHHIRPYEGCTLIQSPGHGNKTCVYRFHITDAIPFERTFRMTMENYAEDVDYSSVAWWYETGTGRNRFFKETPAYLRLPQKPMAIAAIEAESLFISTDEDSKALLVDDENLPEELSRGKGVLLTGAGPFQIEVPAPVPGNYQVMLGFAEGLQHPGLEVRAAGGVPFLPVGFPSRIPGFLDAREAVRMRLHEGKNIITLNPMEADPESAATKTLLDYIELKPVERKPDVVEVEEMKVLSYQGGKVTIEDFALPWSAGAQLRLIAENVTATMNLALPVDVEGYYSISGWCTCTKGYGPFNISIDRKAPVRVIPSELGGESLSRFDMNRVYLTEGRHFLTISTTTTVGLDCLQQVWTLGDEHVFEGEAMTVLASEKGDVSTQNLDPTRFSQGKQLWFKGQAQQAFVELELPVVLSGDYNIKVFFARSWDYGKVQVFLDGKALGEQFDGYNPGVVPSGSFELGRMRLEAGKHRLKFALVGKNDESVGYFMGVDAVKLDPL